MFSVNYNALLIIEMFYANGSIRQQINEEFYSASMYGASETRSYYSKECFWWRAADLIQPDWLVVRESVLNKKKVPQRPNTLSSQGILASSVCRCLNVINWKQSDFIFGAPGVLISHSVHLEWLEGVIRKTGWLNWQSTDDPSDAVLALSAIQLNSKSPGLQRCCSEPCLFETKHNKVYSRFHTCSAILTLSYTRFMCFMLKRLNQISTGL